MADDMQAAARWWQREGGAAALFENSLDAIVIADNDRGCVDINPATSLLLGYSPSQMIGHDLADFAAPALRSRMLRLWARLQSRGQQEGPLLLRGADGQERECECRARANFIPGLHLLVLRDDTSRKRAERDHARLLAREQRARVEAERANRAKDEFLAMVSHELRTPLTTILGWSNVLLAGQLDANAGRHALEVIERSSRVQAQLVEDILDVSRIVSGKLLIERRQVDLTTIVQNAVHEVRLTAEAKKQALLLMMRAGQFLVYGDQARLQQVVRNLLTNAIKFTPRSGQIEVRLSRQDDDAVISVRDNGLGIDAEFLPQVFESFRQADTSYTKLHGGLGLGLAIVQHLVQMQSGSVAAHSDGAGKGATFTVRLPLLTMAQPAAPEIFEDPNSHMRAEAPRLLAGVKVLLAESDADTRVLIATILQGNGADVTAVGTAPAAIGLLPELKPDILISDLGLPGEDGYSLITRVRELPPNFGGQVPAIALTAYTRDAEKQRAIDLGYHQHLAKPVVPDELAAVVASLTGVTARLLRSSA